MIIVDSSFLCHRAKHTLPNLSHLGMDVGIVYGFLNQIFKSASQFNDPNLVFVWDSRKSNRKAIYPWYKYKEKKREKTDMEKEIDWQTNQQIIQLKRIVSYIGFNNSFYQTGFEADDIIAKIVHSHWEELRNSLSKEPSDDCKPIILTSDADIYQLLNYANIYDPRAEKGITAESFKEDWGIDPEQWWRVKAIAGCSSDKVPGITGIGEKKAVKYLLGKMNKKTKEYQKIESEESLEIFNRNKKLVKLPLEGVKEFEIQDDIVSIERLIAVFHQYNFMSFLKKNRLEKIIKIFRG